jgi:hypothetical protein
MRGATQCARRLKQLVRSLRTKLGKPGRPPAGDAITQMILGIFSRDVPESRARAALDRLRALVVDYNELRVVPAIEMTQMVGSLPEARLKCEDLSRALNGVFAVEHEVSLERLRDLSKKEVVEYLDAIEGLDAYSRARVRLLGLQQHAVPLDEAMWAYARKEKVVDPKCSLEEAGAFLERQISEGEALELVELLGKQAWAELGAAVRNREVERISSVPPDRTARNMLQMVAAGRSVSAAALSAEAPAEPVPSTRSVPKAKLATKVAKKTGTAGRAAPKAKPKAAAKPPLKARTKRARTKKGKAPARVTGKRVGGGKRTARKAPAKKVAQRTGRSSRRARSA